MSDDSAIRDLTLHMGDNCLILAQCLTEWCGHAPMLEEDIALANTGLDLIGQTKNWFEVTGSLYSPTKTPDQLAFHRDDREFRNFLLVEYPNADYALTLMKLFLFDTWHYLAVRQLIIHPDEKVVAVAQKSIKEIKYHRDRSTDLVVRLGDGSDESHAKMQAALKTLWRFTGELTDRTFWCQGDSSVRSTLAESYSSTVESVLRQATLDIPEKTGMVYGGTEGVHTEHFGTLVAKMQYLPRRYPEAKW